MKAYWEELNNFLKNKGYMFSLFFIAVLSYGYAAVNTTVSIDDYNGEKFVGSGNVMLSAGRFGMTLFSRIFGYREKYIYNSFTIDVISVFLFLWATINFCILFRRIARKKIGMLSCTVFSCILISYPLMNELWEFTGAGLNVCVEFLFVSVVLLLLQAQIYEKWQVGGVTLSIFLMMLVCASYESLVCVYIFLVFAILSLQAMYGEKKEKNVIEVLRQGIIYAGILGGGFLLKTVLHRVILIVFHLSKITNGSVHIAWGQTDIAGQIWGLLRTMGSLYIIRGIIYMPITEFALCMLLLLGIAVFLIIKYKSGGLLLSFVGMFLSPFLLVFIQGTYTPYRACQVFAVFVAFTLMMFLILLEQGKKKALRIIFYLASGSCLLLCLHQAVYLNYFLTLNHLRWEEEQRVICNVGEELYRTQDVSKPVVFLTEHYNLSDEITEAASISKDSFRWDIYAHMYAALQKEDFIEVFENGLRKLPQTNVNSVLRHTGVNQYLFQFCGFPYIEPNSDMRLDALEYINENEVPHYPKQGYIQDRGDYILVNF